MRPIGRRWTKDWVHGSVIRKQQYSPPPSFYTDWPHGVFKMRRVPHFPAYLGAHDSVRFSDMGIGEIHPSWTCRVLYKMDYPKPRPRLLATRREDARS